MHLELIKGESKSVFVPLYDPNNPPYTTNRFDTDEDGNIVVNLGAAVPEGDLCNPEPSHAFLSGSANGCFEILSWNECRNQVTLKTDECIELSIDRGRYVSACCTGSLYIPPKPLELQFALPFNCLSDTFNAEIKAHVVPETCRNAPLQVVPVNTNTLSAGWALRECLPVGSLIDIPELNLSDVKITGSSTVNNRFLQLRTDKQLTSFNCAVEVYHSCSPVAELRCATVPGGCPILEVCIDSTELVAGAVYHWDLFVQAGKGMTHFHRDSFAVRSSY